MRVGSLQPDDLDAAAEVHAAAFTGNRTIRYFLGSDSHELRRRLFRITTKARLDHGMVTPAVYDERGLQGLALLTKPGVRLWDDELDELWQALERDASPGMPERVDEYRQRHVANAPQSPHLYLVTLSVHPSCHGMGYGGALIEETVRLAREMGYPALALDTDREENRRFYMKRGFEIHAETDYASGPMWFLVRPV